MAKQGQVWELGGKFGISHTGEEPAADAYTFDTKDEATAEAKRIFDKATAVEESCAGGYPSRTAAHLSR
jgi:hypothetical protein